jgi:hypothetical protein
MSLEKGYLILLLEGLVIFFIGLYLQRNERKR